MILIRIYGVEHLGFENLEIFKKLISEVLGSKEEIKFLLMGGEIQKKEEGLRGPGLSPADPFIEVLLPLGLMRGDLETVSRILFQLKLPKSIKEIFFIPSISFSNPSYLGE